MIIRLYTRDKRTRTHIPFASINTERLTKDTFYPVIGTDGHPVEIGLSECADWDDTLHVEITDV